VILFDGYLRWYDGDNLHCIPAPTISDMDRLAIDELDTAIVVSGAP